MRLASTAAPAGGGQNLLAFSGGGAVRPGLESLEYYITSVQICESLQARGSGFDSPGGCLELYSGDRSRLAYELDADWRALAQEARETTAGFVDLLDPTARATLDATTALTDAHVRSYHYGIITWSLPVKVKASVPLADGTFLYTHDGPVEYETIGADSFRHYYTDPTTALNVAPAEKAVVLLGNGGNWFKFQNPLTITGEDVSERRQWVLDLVFNPEGIIKGFAGDGISQSNLQERDGTGAVRRAITVPLLDLAPIPHREDEQVVRESYLASLVVGAQAFDVRLELYSVEGDPNHTIYGVDTKTLMTPGTMSVPTEFSKVSFVVSESDGSITFQSYNRSPIVTGFRHVSEPSGTTTALIRCATHADRAGAEGGAAIAHQRDGLLNAEHITETITAVRGDVVNDIISGFIPPQSMEEQWDVLGLEQALEAELGLQLPIGKWLEEDRSVHEATVRERVLDAAQAAYDAKSERIGPVIRDIERQIMLQVLDMQWKEHLASMDHLRQGIGLRAYAQRNPKQEYKREAFELFQRMLDSIKHEVIKVLARVEPISREQMEAMERQRAEALARQKMQLQHAQASAIGEPEAAEESAQPFVRQGMKVGRNDNCPCGSGKKYKQCHGKLG